jgi:NitT/TauT family transport system ATP-binding protein
MTLLEASGDVRSDARSDAASDAAANAASDAAANAASDTAIELAHVSKAFRSGRLGVLALDDISLTVQRHSLTCVVGASGCGKSTLLNVIAGLDSPTAGTVSVTGRTGLMFQEAALFPWLTAAENVGLALKLRNVPKAQRRARVGELLDLVHLGDFANKRPHELSGGMRQRVSLARAFAQDADVLLMDEPFGALDAMTRDIMHDELESIWRQTGATIVFVTHNVREAARLGDRIVLLTSRPGRLAAEFDVDLPRPRRIEDHGVTDLAKVVTARLRQEVARHGHH